MSFLTAGMLKFLKRSSLKYIYFTLVCLLMLSLWIFPQHSWSSFRPSSPDFKGAFMFSWRIVPVNGNEWLKSRCWMLSYIDKLHEMGTWMNSQPSLQMPSWYLLYQYDCLPTSVRQSTQEDKGAEGVLLVFMFGGSLGSVQRVGVPGKVLWCVGEWPGRQTHTWGLPMSRGCSLTTELSGSSIVD